MHRSAARLLVALSLVAFVAAPARAAPTLALPTDWFSIVDPYRYDEARRFERGWNRGAGARVIGGVVRAPVDGRVRFAGDVAGRSVVTIEALMGGAPVVVTVTGLAVRRVAAGAVVRAGDQLGSGDDVHVGMYDARRRSRYLPVIAQLAVVPAGPADGAASPTLSGAVASRLLDAIRGDASIRPPGSTRPEVPPIPVTGRGGAPGADVVAVGRPVPPAGRYDVSAAPVDAALERWTRPVPFARTGDHRPAPVGGRGVRVRDLAGADAPGPGGFAQVTHSDVDPGHVVGLTAIRSQWFRPHARDDAGFTGVVGRTATWQQWRRPHARGEVGDTPAGGALVSGGGVASGHAEPIDVEPITATRVAWDDPGEDAPIVRSPWTIPWASGALAAVVVLGVARGRRARRPSSSAGGAGAVGPRHPVLPSVATRRVSLAWADHEAGTSTHHERELLRHDADLLPEREPAPGPRVHDDRGGRDHPLPASHGP